MVREIWFVKSGWPEKKVVLYHKSMRNLVWEKLLTRKKKSEFAEPLFYIFLEKWLQNKWSNQLQLFHTLQTSSCIFSQCAHSLLCDHARTKRSSVHSRAFSYSLPFCEFHIFFAVLGLCGTCLGLNFFQTLHQKNPFFITLNTG